jgi:hypothetical protein
VLIQQLGASSLGVVAGVLMIWLATFIWRRLFVSSDPPLPHQTDESTVQGAAGA